MKVLTQRELTQADIAEAAEPMKANTFGADWNRRVSSMRASIAGLDPDIATPGDIQAIREANGFSGPGEVLICGECGAAVEKLIRFGAEEPDYDTSCEDVCLSCVEAAVLRLRA